MPVVIERIRIMRESLLSVFLREMNTLGIGYLCYHQLHDFDCELLVVVVVWFVCVCLFGFSESTLFVCLYSFLCLDLCTLYIQSMYLISLFLVVFSSFQLESVYKVLKHFYNSCRSY